MPGLELPSAKNHGIVCSTTFRSPDPFGVTTYQNAPGIDNKLNLTTSSGSKYFLQDHLGSTLGLANSSGVVTDSNSYDSFGNPTNSSFPTRYQFTGREYDSFTNLQFYRARWYSPNLGRFIFEDPIGFAGGDVNLYSYVQYKPLSLKDPTGKSPLLVVAVAGGILAAEIGVHGILMNIADNGHFGVKLDSDRQKHCWVNCVSTRLHLGSPMPAMAASLAKEAVDLYRLPELWDDSKGDMRANLKGQQLAYVIWQWCDKLCKDCQTF